MIKLFKKKDNTKEEKPQNEDWVSDIKKGHLLDEQTKQMSFLYDDNNDFTDDGTKLGLSIDHIKILKYCKNESSALELMRILKRTNKSKFKNVIINPLIEKSFLELTIPSKPKSPNQKYRLTSLFVRRRIKS